MFSRKLPVVFISRNFIEPGRVILSREPFFEGVEAQSYTEDTLGTVLASVDFLAKAPARIVLAEELVYVIALSFPSGTDLTRDLVREKAEEMVPEDLEATQWDFRTMRYVKQRETKEAIWVQVAVMERSFARALESAIGSGNIAVTSIVPESYALASFTASEEGISVIVEQDRENTLFIACESGLVLVTEVKKGVPDKEMVFAFIRFVEDKVSEQISRIVFSHGENEVFREPVEQAGYRFETQAYNPLLAAAFEKVSGSDERVLNLNSFQGSSSSKWWNIFRKTAS